MMNGGGVNTDSWAAASGRNLSFLRNEELLCDGVLIAGSRRFSVHKILLAAESPYYRAMFTNGMIESTKKEINAPTDDPILMDMILDYIYTKELKLSMNNVFKILPLADLMLMMDLKRTCCDFLEGHIDSSNALEIEAFADQYSCIELRDKAKRHILEHFPKISQQDESYKTLTPEQFYGYLCNDELNIRKEEHLVEAVFRWIEADEENRKSHLPKILKCLRLGMIESDNFQDIVMESPLIESVPGCKEIVKKAAKFLSDIEEYGNKDIDLKNPLVRPRIPSEVLIVIGGWSGGSPIAFFESYDTRADRWYTHSTLEEGAPRAYHGMVTHGDKIYVMGGFDGAQYYNSVDRFDPVKKAWEPVMPMSHQRCYVSAATVDGFIFACGGYDGRLRMRSVERYDPVRDHWRKVADMSCRRSDAGASSLAGRLYVCGGFDGRLCLQSVEMYNPETDQWSLLSAMQSPRSGVSLVAYDNMLYALGGFDGENRLSSVEKLCVAEDGCMWIEGHEMYTARSNFAAAVMDEMIFIIGGFNGTHTIAHVECYDVMTDEWYDATDMNVNRSALKACVLQRLPNVKDYTYHGQKEKSPESRKRTLRSHKGGSSGDASLLEL